jgi:hypothetical protein
MVLAAITRPALATAARAPYWAVSMPCDLRKHDVQQFLRQQRADLLMVFVLPCLDRGRPKQRERET